jgi:Tfp pilus assembly protein FimT
MHKRTGASLTDLIVTLALLAIVLAIAVPRLQGARNAYATRAARDAAAAIVERARVLAAARGTARLIVELSAGTLALESPVGAPARTTLRVQAAFGVTLTVDGHTAGRVLLDFNALGLGVIANRTLRFRRGGAESVLTLSMHGRGRRS